MPVENAEFEAEGDDFALPFIHEGSMECEGHIARSAKAQADFEAIIEGTAAVAVGREVVFNWSEIEVGATLRLAIGSS